MRNVYYGLIETREHADPNILYHNAYHDFLMFLSFYHESRILSYVILMGVYFFVHHNLGWDLNPMMKF